MQDLRVRLATPSRFGHAAILAAMALLVAVVSTLILIDPLYVGVAAVGVFLVLLFFMQLEIAVMVVLAARTLVDLIYYRAGGSVALILPGFPRAVTLEVLIALFITFAGLAYILGHRFHVFQIPLGVPYFVFLLALTTTLVTSWYPSVTLQHLGRITSYFILYVLLWNTIRTPKQRDRWVLFLLLWAAGLALIALFGLAVRSPITGGYLMRQGLYRVSGPLNALEFGTFLLVPLCLATALFLHARGFRKLWLGVLLAVLSGLFVGSLARGPWAGFSASLIVFGLLKYRWLPFAALGLGLAIFLAVPNVAIRVTEVAVTPQETTLANRWEVWKEAYQIWRTSPLLGIGFGVGYVEAGRVIFGRPHLTHNDYVRMLSDGGLFGALAFLFFLAAQGLQGLRVWRRAQNPLHKTLAMAYLGAWAAFLVASITGNVLTHADNQYQYAVLAAVVLALPEIERGSPAPDERG